MSKKKNNGSLILGGILSCIAILIIGCLQPMKVQCAQSKKKTVLTAEDTISDAIRKLEDAQSVHSNVTMKMEVEAFGLNLDTQADLDLIAFRNPYKIKSESHLDMGLLGEKEWTVYATQKGKDYQLYEKNGRKWNVQEAKAKDLLKYDGRNMMKIYLSQIKELQEKGEERLDDSTVIKYTGFIQSDGLKKILLDSGSIDLVGKLFQNSLLKAFGSLSEQKEKVASMIEGTKDLGVTLWIEKDSGYPVRCKMDITESINGAYKELTEGLPSEKAKKVAEKIVIKKTEIVIDCDDFNEAEDFELPVK